MHAQGSPFQRRLITCGSASSSTSRLSRTIPKAKTSNSRLIPKLLFGTPIPDEIIENIKPSYLRERLISYWLHKVSLYNPHEPKFGKIGYILFCGLLYDNVQTLLKSVFPDSDRMKDTYEITNGYLLPYYYCKRILDLMIKRMPT